jgi:virginiamycin A acetyltransferase
VPAPDPMTRHPIAGWKGTAFLRAVVNHPLIEVGDFSYYDDARGPEHFVGRCLRYHFDFIGDRLIIGRYVAIATGVQFVMNGANHPMDGFSTFPFDMIGFTDTTRPRLDTLKSRGDMIIGNDVWLGREAVILPGVRIGDGAIVGTRAVVSRDVPPYSVVVGNPARVVRRRFDDETIEALLDIAWWDWPAEAVAAHVEAIRGADLTALQEARRTIGDRTE